MRARIPWHRRPAPAAPAPASAGTGIAGTGSAEAGSAQAGSAQAGSAQAGSAQAGSAQAGSAGTGSAGTAGGMLRAVLVAVRDAPAGARLDGIAARLGLARDELDAMIDYWVGRGELAVDEIGCPTSGCGGCPLTAACGARERPVLIAIRSRPS